MIHRIVRTRYPAPNETPKQKQALSSALAGWIAVLEESDAGDKHGGKEDFEKEILNCARALSKEDEDEKEKKRNRYAYVADKILVSNARSIK